MQTNEIWASTLNADSHGWVKKLREVLLIQNKGKGTVLYCRNDAAV